MHFCTVCVCVYAAHILLPFVTFICVPIASKFQCLRFTVFTNCTKNLLWLALTRAHAHSVAAVRSQKSLVWSVVRLQFGSMPPLREIHFLWIIVEKLHCILCACSLFISFWLNAYAFADFSQCSSAYLHGRVSLSLALYFYSHSHTHILFIFQKKNSFVHKISSSHTLFGLWVRSYLILFLSPMTFCIFRLTNKTINNLVMIQRKTHVNARWMGRSMILLKWQSAFNALSLSLTPFFICLYNAFIRNMNRVLEVRMKTLSQCLDDKLDVNAIRADFDTASIEIFRISTFIWFLEKKDFVPFIELTWCFGSRISLEQLQITTRWSSSDETN